MSCNTRVGCVRMSLERTIAARPRRVFELLTHHEAMPEWFPAREVVRRRPGDQDPNGLGAIRVVRLLGLALEERVTAFEPDERFGYSVIAGAPFCDHRAEVVLLPEADATLVRWSASLRPRVPGIGWILSRVVARTLRQGLEGLKQRAEAC